MGILGALCIFVAALGVLLIILGILGVFPANYGYADRAVPGGITLLIVGIALYILISLLGHASSWGLLLVPTLLG